MPCPHKGEKTLAAHSQHLEMPCQDFPADLEQKEITREDGTLVLERLGV